MTDWSWAAARAVGTSHLASAQPCQDAFDCTVFRCAGAPPVLVAALADGAGSAPLAETGARVATCHFVEVVHQALLEGVAPGDAEALIRYGMTQVRIALGLVAGRQERSIADYACTLLATVLAADGGAAGQIGDGAIVIDDGRGGWLPVHWPDHGEYANTTRFVTEADFADALQVTRLPVAPRRIAMFSDGLERLVLDFKQRTAHGPFFESVFRRLDRAPGRSGLVSHELEQLLSSERVNARTDDDKSLFCAALIGA